MLRDTPRPHVRATVLLAILLSGGGLPLAIAQSGADEGGRGIGVSPSELDFGNVLRDEPTVRFIEVQNTVNGSARVGFQREGLLAEWVRLPEDVTVPPESTTQIPLTLEVPSDAPHGAHDGRITVILRANDHADPTTVAVQVGVLVRLVASVGGQGIIALDAGRLVVPDAEQGGSVPFSFWLRNRGNVRVAPMVDVRIVDAHGGVAHAETLTAPVVPAGVEEEIALRVSPRLTPGQYWLELVVRAGDEEAMREKVTFDVLEEGMLRRKGEMGAISTVDLQTKGTSHRMVSGKAFVIQVPFRNVGEVDVDARFRGHISKDGVLLKELDTEPLRVAPGENVTIEILSAGFSEPGAYSIRGKVYYSGKVTEENEWILNLQPGAAHDAALDGATAATPGPGGALVALVAAGVAVALGRQQRRP